MRYSLFDYDEGGSWLGEIKLAATNRQVILSANFGWPFFTGNRLTLPPYCQSERCARKQKPELTSVFSLIRRRVQPAIILRTALAEVWKEKELRSHGRQSGSMTMHYRFGFEVDKPVRCRR
ncbi:hypothetical protein F4W66_24985 (plasmid) [Escherichia coli]|nr:hypothetical protein F4W66_24985 [Escherichia coli]